MAFITKKTEVGSELCLTSVGVCLAPSEDKKRPPCLIIAYRTEETVRFVATAYSAKKEYDRESLLSAIAKAEGVKCVSCIGKDGSAKDLCICREDKGKILDFVARDYSQNRFVDGFAEVLSSNLKFKVSSDLADFIKKFDKPLEFRIGTTTTESYAKDSYEYAIINAYNACLLGTIFEREELQLETKGRKKIKIEVRTNASSFVEQDVLYVKPVFRGENEVADYYVTEEFQRIDNEDGYGQSGKDVCAYKIGYTDRFKDYNLIRL